MARFLFRLLTILFAVALLGLVARAQDRGQGHKKGPDRKDGAVSVEGAVVFSAHDRQIIRDYYRGGNLPPGLAKRGGNLPPGLQKQLQRNGTLPPGLQKRLTPFPADLERRLPRLPDVYQRASIGATVVIIDRRTQRIMDVIHDIFRP